MHLQKHDNQKMSRKKTRQQKTAKDMKRHGTTGQDKTWPEVREEKTREGKRIPKTLREKIEHKRTQDTTK